MSCGVGHRHGSDLALLAGLWHRLVATALIPPLAWESPCASGVALKKDKKIEKSNFSQVKKTQDKDKKKENTWSGKFLLHRNAHLHSNFPN